MKNILSITLTILLTFSFAIAQDGINYQGAATDVNGDELTNQNITIRASVLSGGANGNLEWEETYSTTTDQFGLFNVVIGQGTNTTNGATANFNDMDWGSADHYLKIEMDATGGTNYAMIGTTQMMSVPYALYAENINMDSVSDYLTNDSSFMANVGGGENQVESSDFENQTSNSDFNNNITGQVPQALDGKKVIVFSTDKTIYLTDSVGSFLSVLYSVETNFIGNLTANANGDTLYFLQSFNANTLPSIMMTSINNINPVAVGTVPALMNQILQFKYYNGDFYYNVNYKIMKISNGSVSIINTNNNNWSFTVNNSTVYRSYVSGGSVIISGTSYSYSDYQYAWDLDYSPSENRIYIHKNNYGVGYFDITASNNYTSIFSTGDVFPTSSDNGEQVVRYKDGLVYFNQGASLFSVQNDGSNSRVISSSIDETNINGIVPLVFNYQNVSSNPNSTTINVPVYIASNNKKIFYSTDKTIYLTDSVGSFLSVLYSVETNFIGNLTANANGDTLYFLQSFNANTLPSIMMTSINNINPVAVGTVPALMNQILQFKYYNGDFYYNVNYKIMKISNGSVSIINTNNNNWSFTVNNSTVYRSYVSGGSVIISGTSYSYSDYQYAWDLDYSPSENRIYIHKNNYGVGYFDITASNNYTSIFSTGDVFPTSSDNGEQVVRYKDGLVYFNQGASLFSVQNDGSNSRVISSSIDETNINGIVVVD